MCGIVGYVGEQNATSILLTGLKKLEYRGYDSAGIALYDGEKITLNKTVGKLSKLEELVSSNHPEGNIGLGHTRWATHGKPSTPNSHPHSCCGGDFVVVHNGIIENYTKLKAELKEKGHQFSSETDTEVIPHLIDEYYEGDLKAAVRKTVAKLKGAYALGVLSLQEPDKLIAVRQDSPLIIGLNGSENFIASDIPAVLEHTDEVYILDDGEMAEITANQVDIFNVDNGESIKKDIFKVDWDPGMAEKSGFDHFMLKEIHEQPETIRKSIAGRLNKTDIEFDEVSLSKEEIEAYNRIYIVACGTAYHSGLVAKYVIEDLAEIPVEVDVASEFRYRNPLIDDNTLVIVVSQSGETADTLAALREAKDNGARALAVVNTVGSTIAREADDVIYIHAGPEIAVASTKAYIGMLTCFYMLAIYLARQQNKLSDETSAKLIKALKDLPAQVTKMIKEDSDKIKQLAQNYAEQDDAFFIGRKIDYSVALEGSLKLKEISYIHSEAYPAGELKHGTLALIEEGIPVIALATQTSVLDKTLSNVKEVKARGGVVTGVVFAGQEEIDSFDYQIEVPKTEDILSSILTVVTLQLLSYYIAVERGCDVDQPRNLAKSVTVE